MIVLQELTCVADYVTDLTSGVAGYCGVFVTGVCVRFRCDV